MISFCHMTCCTQALEVYINCQSHASVQLTALHAVGRQFRAAVTDRAEAALQWATDYPQAEAPSAILGALVRCAFLCMQALDACINCRPQPLMQLAALHSVGSQVRAAVSDREEAALRWGTDCFAAVAPSAVVCSRELAQSPSVASADAHLMQVRTPHIFCLFASYAQTPLAFHSGYQMTAHGSG